VNYYFQKLFESNSHLSSLHTLLLRYAAQFMHKKGWEMYESVTFDTLYYNA